MTLMLICGSKPKAPVVIGRNETTRRSLAGISHWWTRGLDSNRNFPPQRPQRPPLLVRRLPPASLHLWGYAPAYRRERVRPGWDGERGVGMAAIHFAGRFRCSKKPWSQPWSWSPLGWFRAKSRCRNKRPKGTCRFIPFGTEDLWPKTNQNPGIEFGPTPTHGSRNCLSFYAGLERLDQQPGLALKSRGNHQPPPTVGKSSFVRLWQQGRSRSHGIWACRSLKAADSYKITFSV